MGNVTSQLTEIAGPHYAVKMRGRSATFIWSPNIQETLKSSVDLEIKTEPTELRWLAEKLGCICQEDKIIVPTLDAYNKIIVYACVRPLAKNAEQARELAMVVLELYSLDAIYWASTFRETWWRGERKNIRRIAKAFKLFFNL